MKKNLSVLVNESTCIHERQMKYTERIFDILNGFEIAAIRCYNCHKILELTIKKIQC